MKWSKRFWAFMMALMMLLSVTSAFAEELSEEAQEIIRAVEAMMDNRSENVNIYSMQAYNDVCYGLRNSNALYRYDTQEKAWHEVVAAPEGAEYGSLRFINTDEALMALDTNTGEVFEFVLGEQATRESRYQIPWDNMTVEEGDYSYARQINAPCIKDGTLYMLVQNDNYEFDLNMYNLATMEINVVSMEGVYSEGMVALSDGLVISDWRDVRFYDFATGQMESIYTGHGSLAVAQYADKLYIMDGSEILSNRDGDFAVVGYAPAGVSLSRTNALVLGGKTFMCESYEDSGTTLCEIDISSPVKPDSVLRVVGDSYYMQEAVKAFAQNNPNIPVLMNEDVYFNSAQSVVEHMRGTEPADIYVFSVQNVDLGSLTRKDYALPLDNAMLPDSVYPAFRTALEQDGQLYAMPMSVDGSVMGYAPRFLETFGLTEETLPKTYDELLELVDDYQLNYADEGLDVQLLEDMHFIDLGSRITQYLLIDTETRQRSAGADIRFDSPALLKSLQHVKDTDFTGFFDPNGDSSENGVYYYDDIGARALLTMYVPLLNAYSLRINTLPLLLSVEEGADPILHAYLHCAIINPASANVEAAVELLSKVPQNYSPQVKIMLMSDQNEPVVNEYAVETLPRAKEAVAYLKEQVALADEQVARELQDFVTNYELMLDHYENDRYIVSEEAIAKYREIAQYIVPHGVTFVGTYDEELNKLMSRFAENSLDAQGFLKELDRRVQMMALEGD